MIWRLALRSDHSIADFHYAIQIAMGWSDSYLHRFHIHGKDYGVAHERGLRFFNDPDRVRLAQLGFRLRERFLYEYDFYDNWKHNVRLEKMLLLNSKRVFPVCNGGQRPVPPEDYHAAARSLIHGKQSTSTGLIKGGKDRVFQHRISAEEQGFVELAEGVSTLLGCQRRARRFSRDRCAGA